MKPPSFYGSNWMLLLKKHLVATTDLNGSNFCFIIVHGKFERRNTKFERSLRILDEISIYHMKKPYFFETLKFSLLFFVIYITSSSFKNLATFLFCY